MTSPLAICRGNLGGCHRLVTPSCYAGFGWDTVRERVPHCRQCAKVKQVNPESWLNGTTPEPSEPARDGDNLARLKLTQALQRARYAIAWERTWPQLARLLTVAGLFLVLSWAGLWLALPFLARVAGLVLFVVLALAAIWPLVWFRWPSRDQGLSRLDR